MKKIYQNPACQCVALSAEDLIRTSTVGLSNIGDVNADQLGGISFRDFLNG